MCLALLQDAGFLHPVIQVLQLPIFTSFLIYMCFVVGRGTIGQIESGRGGRASVPRALAGRWLSAPGVIAPAIQAF